MRKLLLVMLFLAVAAPASANFNLNLLLGQKNLSSGDWEPVENQGLVGVHFDGTPAGWPVALSVDLIVTAEEATVYYQEMGSPYRAKVTGATSEYDIGVRRYFGDVNTFSAFLGGGVAMIGASAEASAQSYGRAKDEDSALGVWLSGGIMARPLEHLNLGIDLRWSKAEVELFDTTAEAGGVSYVFFVGYGF